LIDIDILFFDDVVMSHQNLSIPHPGIPSRATVLVPLSDIAPELRHPITHRSVREMLAAMDVSGVHLVLQSS
jgi:7,8-dihydro-6-hydroxymethylpterin-pyrophosphokinase